MKKKNQAGFSLIEVLVAIVLLGAIVVPTCTGLVLSVRLNEKSKAMMQAQLTVSSVVETLLASGITEEMVSITELYPGVEVTINVVESQPYYEVTVTDDQGLVTVRTTIRKVEGGS